MKMTTTTLQFSSLAALAAFLKKVNPKGYVVNTLQLSLTTRLNDLEIAIAVDQYSAALFQQITLHA